MRPPNQEAIDLAEKELEVYRRERCKLSARVRLDRLKFEEGFSHRMDDGRNTIRLGRVFSQQGCSRIKREHHVPVLVSQTEWNRITVHTSDEELFPELLVPSEIFLRAQCHKSVIAAAKKEFLGENQWWVVDVYLVDSGEQSGAPPIQSHLIRSLQEHFPNERQPPDGLIYERIRHYTGHLGSLPDPDAVEVWWAVLQQNPKSNKHRYLRAFLKHPTFPQAFDALLPVPGLWGAMHIGVLHTLISLRCDEPIQCYLKGIHTVWMSQIFDHDTSLAAHADAKTVEALESRAPGISQTDREDIKSQMDDRKLFCSIQSQETRNAIWDRLQHIDAPIPTLRTFFQDVLYLGVARNVMVELVSQVMLTSDSISRRTRSIDAALDGQYRVSANMSLQKRRERLHQGLLELWRFSFQFGIEMTGAERLKGNKKRGPPLAVPLAASRPALVDRTSLWCHFLQLAHEQGFHIPAMAGVEPGFVDLPEPHPSDLDGVDEDESVARRCGRPHIDTVDAHRVALRKDRLWEPWTGGYITAEFVRRSQFHAFFRYLRHEATPNPPGSSPTEAARSNAAMGETDARDDTSDGQLMLSPVQSPGIADSPAHAASVDGVLGLTQFPGLDRRFDGPHAEATLFNVSTDEMNARDDANVGQLMLRHSPTMTHSLSQDPGADSALDIAHLPGFDGSFDCSSIIWTADMKRHVDNIPMRVDVIMPGHETRTIILPNDREHINYFMGELKQRGFEFYWRDHLTKRPMDEDFFEWHQRNHFEPLHAELISGGDEGYTVSEANRQKD